jgi:hypothetical protein
MRSNGDARTRIASQWFRHAQAQADSTTRYISHWLVLEALELDENPNIAPLKRAVAGLLGADMSHVAARLGRLYGTRSKLVHGQVRAVDDADIDAVQSVAKALLQWHLFGRVGTDALAQLRDALAG